MTKFTVNGQAIQYRMNPATPLLWALRDASNLTGTKYGCGNGHCGACTVHVDGQPMKSCSVTSASVAGREIKTIEGLSADTSHAVQRAWIEQGVPQCGYCQSGQIMAAVSLLQRAPKPTDRDIDEAMAGNLCRCGTYAQIRRAIKRAAEIAQG